jgi:uncharacterized protein (TIGR02145 family)
MKKTLLLLIALLAAGVSHSQTYNYGDFVYGFGVGSGEAENTSFVIGLPFYSQFENSSYSFSEGVMQAHQIRLEMALAGLQNDPKMSPVHIKDTTGFFGGYQGEELVFDGTTIYVFPAGHYDSTAIDVAHYNRNKYNYDSLTTLVMDVYPVYEMFDTLYIDSAELADYAYNILMLPNTEPALHGGPNRYDMVTEHFGDSLLHFYVFLCGGIVRDADGNEYTSLFIGDAPQRYCWTKPNMTTTKYAKSTTDFAAGDPVENMIYYSDTRPDMGANLNTFGRLYTWYAAVGLNEGSNDEPTKTNNGGFVTGICPIGWHVPDSANILSLSELDALELMSDILWLKPGYDTGAGFYALPAGIYNYESARFEEMLGLTSFWSIARQSHSECMVCSLLSGCNKVIFNDMSVLSGASVRCVKNQVFDNNGNELND